MQSRIHADPDLRAFYSNGRYEDVPRLSGYLVSLLSPADVYALIRFDPVSCEVRESREKKLGAFAP